MPWFKVDDTLANHPKARAAGLPAVGLWAVAGAYASQYLTDGFVPEWYVDSWPDGREYAAELVEVRLWFAEEGGWSFHQWDERQPTKEQVEADRAASRERQRRARDKAKLQRDSGVSNGVTDGVTNGDVTPGVTVPPTRPDPTRSSSGTTNSRAKRGTQMPSDWSPKPDHLEIAIDYGLDPAFELKSFKDHNDAKGGVYKDWDAAFRNWLNKAKTFQRPAPRPGNGEFDWDAAMDRANEREAS